MTQNSNFFHWRPNKQLFFLGLKHYDLVAALVRLFFEKHISDTDTCLSTKLHCTSTRHPESLTNTRCLESLHFLLKGGVDMTSLKFLISVQ